MKKYSVVYIENKQDFLSKGIQYIPILVEVELEEVERPPLIVLLKSEKTKKHKHIFEKKILIKRIVYIEPEYNEFLKDLSVEDGYIRLVYKDRNDKINEEIFNYSTFLDSKPHIFEMESDEIAKLYWIATKENYERNED